MCGNEEDAREVLQETLLAAFRNLPGFRGDAALSTWLYQIARSFCIKERRHDRPEVPLDEDAWKIAAPVPGPSRARTRVRSARRWRWRSLRCRRSIARRWSCATSRG
jgi:DNA-directed RNA polymerase specialized sigma24 family protein